MSSTLDKQRGHVTEEAAAAEPYAEQLFNQPVPAMSPATRAAFARIEAQRRAEQAARLEKRAA